MKNHTQSHHLKFASFLVLVFAALPLFGQTSRDEMISKSTIIFSGQVTEIAATSFPGVKAAPNTIVVKVNSVLAKPEAISLKSNDMVTVEVKDPRMFKAGVRATFYTMGWIFGEGLAVQEIGSEILPATSDPNKMSTSSSEATAQAVQESKENSELQKRIQAADLVFTGKVASIRPDLVASPEKGYVSEHDPQWQNAVVRVDSAIKGATPQQEVVVRFPASLDVIWANSPKFKEGQEGTFILQTDSISGKPRAMLAGNEVPTYVAPTLQDVLPKEEEQRIRKLLK
jgi:hypothetical protein